MWTYEQSSGKIFDPSGALAGTGYSGAPEGKNNSLMQAIHNIGPIPIGFYTIEAPIDSAVHGKYAMRLIPDVLNEMFGRDGFLIHGDSVVDPGTASEGCIIQAKNTRVAIWESSDHRLEVVEKYNG